MTMTIGTFIFGFVCGAFSGVIVGYAISQLFMVGGRA